MYGDEVCDILTNELEMPDVPNEVFPEGVQVGNLSTRKTCNLVFSSLVSSTTTVRMLGGKTLGRGQRRQSAVR